MRKAERWLRAPAFLSEDESKWPDFDEQTRTQLSVPNQDESTVATTAFENGAHTTCSVTSNVVLASPESKSDVVCARCSQSTSHSH